MTKKKARRINTIAAVALAVLVAGVLPLALAPEAEADDRDLFRQASGAPYLFILFDNTGSMQRRVDNGVTATLRDDDPASRLFQAKAALDQVLIGTEGVNFGFATFPNQSGHRITNKTNSNQRVSNSESASNHCDGIEPNFIPRTLLLQARLGGNWAEQQGLAELQVIERGSSAEGVVAEFKRVQHPSFATAGSLTIAGALSDLGKIRTTFDFQFPEGDIRGSRMVEHCDATIYNPFY